MTDLKIVVWQSVRPHVWVRLFVRSPINRHGTYSWNVPSFYHFCQWTIIGLFHQDIQRPHQRAYLLLILLVESLVEIPDEINFSQEIDTGTPTIEALKIWMYSKSIEVSCECDNRDETDDNHQECLTTSLHITFVEIVHCNRDYFVLEPMEGFEPTTRALQVRCSGQLSYIGILLIILLPAFSTTCVVILKCFSK